MHKKNIKHENDIKIKWRQECPYKYKIILYGKQKQIIKSNISS